MVPLPGPGRARYGDAVGDGDELGAAVGVGVGVAVGVGVVVGVLVAVGVGVAVLGETDGVADPVLRDGVGVAVAVFGP